MHPKPITSYVAVIDTFHANLLPAPGDLLSASSAIDFTGIRRSSAPTEIVRGDFRLELVKHRRSNLYQVEYAVMHDGELFGSIHLEHRDGFANQKQYIPLHVENRFLYTNWLPVFTSFLQEFQLSFAKPSKLHIAIDTNRDAVKGFFKLQDNAGFKMKLAGMLADGVNTYGKRLAGGKREDSIYIGSAKSAKQTVIYAKSKEIADSGKAYITTFHAANGLDVSQSITRIELRLTADAFTDYTTRYVSADGELLSKYRYERTEGLPEGKVELLTERDAVQVDVARLASPAYLVSLYAHFNMIDFRHANATRFTRCKSFNFIDFTKYNKENIMVTSDSKTVVDAYEQTCKQIILSHVKLFKQVSKWEHYDSALALANASGLRGYLVSLVERFNLTRAVNAALSAHSLLLADIAAPLDAAD